MSRGFTAVEVLITLFVGSLFLLGGYQLYGIITARSSEARELAEVSNIAYGVLRSRGSAYMPVTNDCNNPLQENVDPSTIPETVGVPISSITIRRCMSSTSPEINLVAVVVAYGSSMPRKEVVHAIYIPKS